MNTTKSTDLDRAIAARSMARSKQMQAARDWTAAAKSVTTKQYKELFLKKASDCGVAAVEHLHEIKRLTAIKADRA